MREVWRKVYGNSTATFALMQPSFVVATLADLEQAFSAEALDVFDVICKAQGIAVPEPSIPRRMLLRACHIEFPEAIAHALAAFPLADSILMLLRMKAALVAARVAHEWQSMNN